MERRNLIQQAKIIWDKITSGMAFGFGGEFRMGQKTEHAQPIANGYDHQALCYFS